jgi:hypothetical protein
MPTSLEYNIRDDIGNGLLPAEIIKKHKITRNKYFSIHKAWAKESTKRLYKQNIDNMAFELELYLDNGMMLRRRVIEILDSYKQKGEIPPMEYVKLIMDIDNHMVKTKSETIQAINLMGIQAHQILREKEGLPATQKKQEGIY